MKIKPNPDLTAIIIAQNEATMLAACLRCLAFCGEIIVVDNQSIDQTAAIAKKAGARTLTSTATDFATLRNFALAHATTSWVLYIDADERVTPALASEVNRLTAKISSVTAGSFLRQNYFYGQLIRHGGYENDLVTRLFQRKHLVEWVGAVHETPVFSGNTHTFKNTLPHLTHRNTHDNLLKTAAWTDIEATLLAASPQTPKVSRRLIFRKGAAEFYRRYYQNHGQKDGMVGFIEAVTQAINKILIYIQVWEKQQQPSLPDRYAALEEKIKLDWEG